MMHDVWSAFVEVIDLREQIVKPTSSEEMWKILDAKLQAASRDCLRD